MVAPLKPSPEGCRVPISFILIITKKGCSFRSKRSVENMGKHHLACRQVRNIGEVQLPDGTVFLFLYFTDLEAVSKVKS
jgi:hypothetical protein